MKSHQFKLTNHVKQIIEVTGIKDGVVYKKNGEVAKIFKVKIPKDFKEMSFKEKQQFTHKFVEFLEKTKSEVQITMRTNNYYIDTYVDRIKKQINDNARLITKDMHPVLKNLVHYIQEEVKDATWTREFYITISFDDYKLRSYAMFPIRKKVYNFMYSRLTKLNKAVFADRIIKLENRFANIKIHNYQKNQKLQKFLESETKLLKNCFEVEELNDSEIISLYNGYFYENLYKKNMYYTILDFIDMYANQANLASNIKDQILNIFQWHYKSDFTEAQINSNFMRILSFFEYPINIKLGFWEFLVDHRGNYNLSMFFKQTTKDVVLEDLTRRKKLKEEELGAEKVRGFADESIQNEITDLDNIIKFVNEDTEKMFLMSVYMLLKEINKTEIQKLSDDISILLNENKVVFKIQPLKNIITDFDSMMPINKNSMKNYKFLSSSTVRNMYPFIIDFANPRNKDVIRESKRNK